MKRVSIGQQFCFVYWSLVFSFWTISCGLVMDLFVCGDPGVFGCVESLDVTFSLSIDSFSLDGADVLTRILLEHS